MEEKLFFKWFKKHIPPNSPKNTLYLPQTTRKQSPPNIEKTNIKTSEKDNKFNRLHIDTNNKNINKLNDNLIHSLSYLINSYDEFTDIKLKTPNNNLDTKEKIIPYKTHQNFNKNKKKIRFCSPQLKTIKDDEFNFKNIKKIREICLEREINVLKLINQLKEEENLNPNYNSKLKLKICLDILDIYDIQEFNELKPLVFVKSILEKYIFCIDKEMKNMIVQCDEFHLICQNNIYFKIVEGLCQNYLKMKENFIIQINKLNHNIKDLEIINLKEKEKNENLQIEINEIEQKTLIKNQKETNNKKEKESQLTNELNKMLRENSKLKEEIIIDRIETQNKDLKQKEEFDDIVKKLQNENDKFQKIIISKSEEIKHLSNKSQNIISNYRELLTRAKIIKEKITEYEKTNELLSKENHFLKIRASTAWEEMTPRPNYKSFEEQYGFEDSMFKNKTTKIIFKDILEYYNNLVNGLNIPLKNSKYKINIKSFKALGLNEKECQSPRGGNNSGKLKLQKKSTQDFSSIGTLANEKF